MVRSSQTSIYSCFGQYQYSLQFAFFLLFLWTKIVGPARFVVDDDALAREDGGCHSRPESWADVGALAGRAVPLSLGYITDWARAREPARERNGELGKWENHNLRLLTHWRRKRMNETSQMTASIYPPRIAETPLRKRE